MGALKINPGDLRRVQAELARRDFLYFVGMVRDYKMQWFHEVVGMELQRAGTASCSTRLGLALPPGHAKSEYAILYCAWMIARDPDITIKYVTYSQEFAQTQFERLKEVLTSESYTDLFGQVINARRVVTDASKGKKNSASMVEIIGGSGWVQACGFGGGITGGRCDIIVIDDPFKNHEEAYSPTTRNKRWNEYQASIKTRKRVGRPLRILMLFTRWHLDDLAGRCKEIEPDRWRWVEFEALKDTVCANDDIEARDPRNMGELLWPGVFTMQDLEEARDTAPGIFMSMYQQKPVPEGGALWKEVWCQNRYKYLPKGKGTWIQSWDFRGGGKGTDGKGKGTSWAVGLLLFRPANEARLYLVDVVRHRWGPTETLEQFQALQDGHELWSQATKRYLELKADGVSVHSRFSRQYSGMLALKPSKDKEQRARDVATFVRAGQLVLPERAPWLTNYTSEIFTFPGGVNDDQMDATTQVLNQEFNQTKTRSRIRRTIVG